jgi:hypothetical protein
VKYDYVVLKDGIMRLTDEEFAESWRTAEEAWKDAASGNHSTVSVELRTQEELRRPKKSELNVVEPERFHFEGF